LSKKCTPQPHTRLPFSTREVLATISSPLRVCLTPWSVFQDGWRYPNEAPTLSSRRSPWLAQRCPKQYLRPCHQTQVMHLFARQGYPKIIYLDNAVGLVLAKKEVLPLSLSRLQVLCHSLSKVLFKLSLTLLVRYRSSYFVFNLGRHIPAD